MPVITYTGKGDVLAVDDVRVTKGEPTEVSDEIADRIRHRDDVEISGEASVSSYSFGDDDSNDDSERDD
jgi:hypothetical protein